VSGIGGRLEAVPGRGCLGTGVFVLGMRPDAEVCAVRPWVCLLFFPVVPLRPFSLRRVERGSRAEAVLYEPVADPNTRAPSVLRGYLSGLAGLALVLAGPLYAFAHIHETGVAQALRIVLGGALPVLAFSWLDRSLLRLRRV
jgi:hypothetical protein